jgi:hypothetical protein
MRDAYLIQGQVHLSLASCTSSKNTAGYIMQNQSSKLATNLNADMVHDVSDWHSLGNDLSFVHRATAITSRGSVYVKPKGMIKLIDRRTAHFGSPDYGEPVLRNLQVHAVRSAV